MSDSPVKETTIIGGSEFIVLSPSFVMLRDTIAVPNGIGGHDSGKVASLRDIGSGVVIQFFVDTRRPNGSALLQEAIIPHGDRVLVAVVV